MCLPPPTTPAAGSPTSANTDGATTPAPRPVRATKARALKNFRRLRDVAPRPAPAVALADIAELVDSLHGVEEPEPMDVDVGFDQWRVLYMRS